MEFYKIQKDPFGYVLKSNDMVSRTIGIYNCEFKAYQKVVELLEEKLNKALFEPEKKICESCARKSGLEFKKGVNMEHWQIGYCAIAGCCDQKVVYKTSMYRIKRKKPTLWQRLWGTNDQE